MELHVEGRGNELLLPYPATVLSALVRLAQDPAFWGTALTSLARIAAGMAAGVALGSALAALTCASSWCERLFAPGDPHCPGPPRWPPSSCWSSCGPGGIRFPAVISGLMVLPVVWENLTQGIRSTDRQLLELSRAYRFSRGKTVRLVYLPSLKPYLLSAVTTAMGLAWKSGVAAEVLCLPRPGIGTEINHAKQAFETADLFAWTAVVICLSLLMERFLTGSSSAEERGRRHDPDFQPDPGLRGQAGAGPLLPHPAGYRGDGAVRPLRLRQDHPHAVHRRAGTAPKRNRLRHRPQRDGLPLSGGPAVPLAHGGAAPHRCAPQVPPGGGGPLAGPGRSGGGKKPPSPPPCRGA